MNPLSVEEISDALRKLLADRSFYSNSQIDFSQFRWEWIAEKYIAHYKDILGLPDVDKQLLQSYVPGASHLKQ